eukprot:2354604-Prymnesium_polylepis.1
MAWAATPTSTSAGEKLRAIANTSRRSRSGSRARRGRRGKRASHTSGWHRVAFTRSRRRRQR